jgi:hypothetical protein
MELNLDMDQLVEAVTKELLLRLNQAPARTVLTLDGCTEDLLADGCRPVCKADCGDAFDYVLMTAETYRALSAQGAPVVAHAAAPPAEGGRDCGFDCAAGDHTVDLTDKRLLHERDLRDHNVQNGSVVRVSKRAIITALANDYAKGHGVKIVKAE